MNPKAVFDVAKSLLQKLIAILGRRFSMANGVVEISLTIGFFQGRWVFEVFGLRSTQELITLKLYVCKKVFKRHFDEFRFTSTA